MHKRFAVVFLAAVALAAVFILPAQAANRSTHRAFRSSVRAVAAPKGSANQQGSVNVAWTPAATLPTAVEETGGGAAAGSTFYVIGGYTSFSPATVTNANQVYKKTTNTWSMKAPIPGTGGGWADAAFCYNSADKTIHVVNGVDGAFLYAAHQVYSTTTNVWSFLTAPNTPATGNFYSQDSGCAWIGGKMYLWSGYGLTDANPTAAIQRLTWVYDPLTDLWADTGFQTQHARLWMGYTGNTTTAFAAGGTDNLSTLQSLGSTERFTPAGGWVAGPNLPGGATLLAPGEGVVATKHLMIWGGASGNVNIGFTLSNKTYHSTLPANTTFTSTAFNLPSAKWFSAWASGAALFNGGGDTGAGVPVNTAEHLP